MRSVKILVRVALAAISLSTVSALAQSEVPATSGTEYWAMQLAPNAPAPKVQFGAADHDAEWLAISHVLPRASDYTRLANPG
jgi:hypothetical protein